MIEELAGYRSLRVEAYYRGRQYVVDYEPDFGMYAAQHLEDFYHYGRMPEDPSDYY